MSAEDYSSMLWLYMTAAALLALPGIPVILWQRYYVRHAVSNVPPGFSALWLKKIALGLALGCGLVVLVVLPGLAAGAYNPAHPDWQAFGNDTQGAVEISVGGRMLLFALQSAFEELMYRAVYLGLFGILLLWVLRLVRVGCSEQSGQVRFGAWLWTGGFASTVIAVAFALNHAGNPGVSGLALVNIALAGLMLGLIAWAAGDIWAAWALHFVWNFLQSLLGLPVSGIHELSSGPISGAVPGLLTGGRFGPEASLVCTVTLVAAISVIIWLTAWRKSASRTTADTDASATETRAQI